MKKLIDIVTSKDCKWQFFRAGGKGGQHQNKTSSGARCIHKPSGARGESREERSQFLNKRKAFRRMAESNEFLIWTKQRAGLQVTVEAEINKEVDKQMNPKNLLIEYYTPE